MKIQTNIQTSFDVIVIGAGVVGVCCAYFLRETGRRVLLVDKEDIAAGSSYGNAGQIVPGHCFPLSQPDNFSQVLRWLFNPESPFYIRPRMDIDLLSWLWRFHRASNVNHRNKAMHVIRDLIMESRELYRSFSEMDDMEFGLKMNGAMHIYSTENGFRHGKHEAQLVNNMGGIHSEFLNKNEVSSRLGVVTANIAGGIYYPEDAHLIPADFVKSLAIRFQTIGGDFLNSTLVQGFERDDRKITAIKTSRGILQADEIIVATGSWTPNIIRELSIKVPIQAAKGYSLTYRRPVGIQEIPVLCGESRVAVTPMGDTLRFAGTLELVGLDSSINQRRVDAVARAPSKYIPEYDSTYMDLIEVWAGLRPVTPDGLSMLGRSPSFDNLILAAGHAMIGMASGPASAKLITQIITGEPTFMDVSLMDPARFG